MPNIKSAKKHVKTDALRTMRNKSRKSEMRTFEKKFYAKMEDQDFESAKIVLQKVFSLYDKAAKYNVIHRNQANRKKSRLTAFYRKASSK